MKTTGKIIDIKKAKQRRIRNKRDFPTMDQSYIIEYYYPVISFKASTGLEHEEVKFISKRYSEDKDYYKIGDTVDIEYDEKKPEGARHIHSISAKNRSIMIGMVILLIIVIFVVMSLF